MQILTWELKQIKFNNESLQHPVHIKALSHR